MSKKKGWPKNPELSTQLWRQMQLNKPCFTQLHYLVPQKLVILLPTEIFAFVSSILIDWSHKYFSLNEANYLGPQKKSDEQGHLIWYNNDQLFFNGEVWMEKTTLLFMVQFFVTSFSLKIFWVKKVFGLLCLQKGKSFHNTNICF